jgi:hypothetical protein
LTVARRKDGAFEIDADSGRILKLVNTNALQYAPSISADRLELYFTRASQLSAVAHHGGDETVCG